MELRFRGVNTVNLKNGAFVVIILLNKRLTQVHSQQDPDILVTGSLTVCTGPQVGCFKCYVSSMCLGWVWASKYV